MILISAGRNECSGINDELGRISRVSLELIDRDLSVNFACAKLFFG